MRLRIDYIKRKHKNKTYVYPFLVSSYRDTKGVPQRKIVLNLSALPGYAVAVLDAALREGDTAKMYPISGIAFEGAVSLGATWAVYQLMEALGINSILRKFLHPEHIGPIMASIIDRVINPRHHSKRTLAESYPDSALALILGEKRGPALDTWYEALRDLYNHQKEIQKGLLPEQIKQSERLYLYDITSSYFEGKRCPLAHCGYNRDGKKGKKQIVIGLLTTSLGRPVAVRVFKGNTQDQSTVLNQIRELRDDFGLKQLVFIGDRGMITSKRIDELSREEFTDIDYITALKRSEMMRLVEDTKHPLQPSLFDRKNLAEVEFGGRRYILCHNPLKKDQDTALRDRLLAKTEEKLEGIAKAVASGRLKKKDKIAKRLYGWINRWNCERFFEVDYDEGRFEFHRNQSEIERYAQLDGCYVIVTSIGDEMDATEVQGRYKSLSCIEKAFRQMKTTDLFVRPIRHWTEERVRGHVFVCMLSYLVIWEARCRLEPVLERDPVTRGCEAGSLRETWEELDKIQLATLNIAGRILKQLRPITSYQQKLLDLLDAKLGKAIRKRLEIAA